jgi:hypothetical protein
MTAKQIPIADAFRARLRATHPERTDLQQIDSIRWFHDRKVITVGKKHFHDLADEPAYAAYDLLKADVKSQKIQIRGMLESADAQIEDIDPIYAREGELDVFGGTLKIYKRKDTLGIARTYTSVHCYADDIKALLSKPSTRRGRRPRIDWDVIELALQHEIATRGLPSPDNDNPDWRSQADVERWAAQLLQDRNEKIEESWLREKVSEMLKHIEAGK